MAQEEFGLVTMSYEGLEKECDWPFVLTAGQYLKVELGPEDEIDETVPAGKVWYGKMQIFIREADA